MEKIVSLCKRRGFVYPGSEIYGGLANTWDYGPLGALVLSNIKKLWWERFVEKRDNIFPVDTGIIMNPKVWEASGHVASFTDPLVECKNCHLRFREDHLQAINTVRSKTVPFLTTTVSLDKDQKIALIESQVCKKSSDGKHKWTERKLFNLMFKTFIGPTEEKASVTYLRPETAQGMFVNFKNILNTERPELPFGIAQIGKAFRNEITPGNFIFRTLEFEQMEIEYFVRQGDWERVFEEWKKEMWKWLVDIGVKTDDNHLKWRPHEQKELSHYSKRTEDVEFNFPFGWGELYGLAYRGDYDLHNHENYLNNTQKLSGQNLKYKDPNTGEEFFPHVVEPTFGVNRTFLAILLSAYEEEDDRVVLKLNPHIAPYKVAVFPLVANKEELVKKAKEIYLVLRLKLPTAWDDRGNIGKRYYAQDEIGTPWCVTIDYQTLEDDTVTVRDRDTMKQERVEISNLKSVIDKRLGY